MNKLSKFLCLLLSLLLLTQAPLLALAEDAPADPGEEAAAQEDVELPEELIVGHPTVTKGDFFTEMFGNDTADIDVRALVHGYNLVNWDQNQGVYVFDPSVVKEMGEGGKVEVDAQGNHTYKLILWDDLYYSDGTKITAWDYAFSILLMMSPEVEAIGGKIYRAEHLLGYDDYIKTRKKIMAGEPVDTSETGDVLSLSGIQVIDDYQIWFNLDGEFLPYFFETGLLMTVPYPIDVIAPGCKVYSNGLGVYIGNAENPEESFSNPVFTPELLKKTILDPETGYNSHPSVVSGPYIQTSWDAETGEGHYEINPYFKGAWYHNTLPGEDYSGKAQFVEVTDPITGERFLDLNGDVVNLVKPNIEKITFRVADNDTLIDELAAGTLHLVNKVTYGPTIEQGKGRMGEGRKEDDKYGIKSTPYSRIGLSFLTFTYDWPTVHEMEVRQAIAWCMDRDLLTEKYCGRGNALRVDGYFGIEQWEYKLLTHQIDYPINFFDAENPPQVRTYADGTTEDITQTYPFRYYTTQEEKEALQAVWDQLADQWADALVIYNVDLNKANALLDAAGWTLNREGNAYTPGTDDVRCKMVDGELVALDLKMMYPEGNHMAEIMQYGVQTVVDDETGEEKPVEGAKSFVDNLAAVGIKLTLVPTPMADLLKSYYRQTERTTDMIYLATNFHVIVDPSITYSTDHTKNHEIWNNTYSDDQILFDNAVAMRKTEPGNIYEYVSEWITFQKRYNLVLPTIPIYSNIYYDFYNEYLQDYNIMGQVTWSQAILPAYFALQGYEWPTEEAEEGGEGEIIED